MKDLIEALLIIQKYLIDPETELPTACEHDILYVCNVNFENITIEDLHRLAELGFFPGDGDCDSNLICIYDENGDYDGDVDFKTISQEDWNSIKDEFSTYCFHSYRFGSC